MIKFALKKEISLHTPSLVNTLIYYSALILNIFLGWLLTKINTAYLEVSAYGQYVFFISFLLIAKSFFSLGFFESISRLIAISNKGEESEFYGTGFVWAFIFAGLGAAVVFLSGQFIDNIFRVKIGFLCERLAFGISLYVILSYLSLALRGSGKIRILALVTILPRLIYLFSLIYLIFYWQYSLYRTLLMMFLSMTVVLLIIAVRSHPSVGRFRHISNRIWSEVKGYGRHIYVSTIWTDILYHADKLIISYFLDEANIAYYGLGFILAFPLSHFSTSLSTSLFQRFASTKRIGRKVILANLTVVAFTVLIFITLREPIIIYLFSKQYLPTIQILPPLAIAFGFSGLSKPFTLFLMAQRRGKIVRNISILIPSIHIFVNILVVPVYGINGAAWTACFIYGLDLVLYASCYHYLFRRSDKKLYQSD